MEHFKLQLGCLVILLFIAYTYVRELRTFKKEFRSTLFGGLIFMGIVSVILDGMTAYAVNNAAMEIISKDIFIVLHLLSLDAVIFMLCIYMLQMINYSMERLSDKILILLPFIGNIIMVVGGAGNLEVVEGHISNYMTGSAIDAGFAMAGFYTWFCMAVFAGCKNRIEKKNRVSVFIYLLIAALVTAVQMIFPHIQITSIAVAVAVLGVYMNLEDPAMKELTYYHNEMVVALANLIENRDGNTGGHVKRTGLYILPIAEELRKKGMYEDVLTRDYVSNLVKAAPMHDIGKVSIPDAVLLKPGKLTEEEFSTMKEHASKGGCIIKQNFKSLGDNEYSDMAYQVARYHHEKWNGKGYPEGLKEDDIPLCARIMAVADVFDAVSEKRCYRDAMPLDKCFEIIEEGKGTHFEPVIVDAFMSVRDKIEKIHKQFGMASENAC